MMDKISDNMVAGNLLQLGIKRSLRANPVRGFAFVPSLGRPFVMLSTPLHPAGSIRIIHTSPVVDLEFQEGTWTISTETSSVYTFTPLLESDAELIILLQQIDSLYAGDKGVSDYINSIMNWSQS